MATHAIVVAKRQTSPDQFGRATLLEWIAADAATNVASSGTRAHLRTIESLTAPDTDAGATHSAVL
jgi:hypothetical protein